MVLLTGARQVGKSTLVQTVASSAWPARYVTLDDRTVLDAALRDPDGFIAGMPTPVILDEVQRAPDLLRVIKLAVDRNRQVARDLAGRVRLSILLYPGTDTLPLDAHTLAVPFSIFFGVD